MWKSKLPQEVLDQWQPWAEQIQELNNYKFKRALMPGQNAHNSQHIIHVLADASEDTYAAVPYMKTKNAGDITVIFIQARSKIKPVKATHTIPYMELLSVELGLSLLKKLANKTFGVPIFELYLWNDSQACYDWMRIETRSLQEFIKNRVLKVRQYLKLEQIRWVPGPLNPADIATRGMTVAQLKENPHCLEGPDFLMLKGADGQNNQNQKRN
jgi:hypothetical protein